MLKNKDKNSSEENIEKGNFSEETTKNKNSDAAGATSNVKSDPAGVSNSTPVLEKTQKIGINKNNKTNDKSAESKEETETEKEKITKPKDKLEKEKKSKSKKEKPEKKKKEKKSKNNSKEVETELKEEVISEQDSSSFEKRKKTQQNISQEFTQVTPQNQKLTISQNDTLGLDGSRDNKKNRKQNKVLKIKQEVETKYKTDLENSIKANLKDVLKEEVKVEYQRELYNKRFSSIAKGNKYIRNALIALVLTTFLLILDLTLKHFFFDAVKAKDFDISYPSGKYDWNIKIIAGRSLLHSSTTFLDFMGASMPNWAILLINFLIAGLFLLMILLSKSKAVVIGLAIALAGVFGNTMDNYFQSGVRDIFVTPWWDRGTFNLADLFVVIGATFAGISFFWITFRRA